MELLRSYGNCMSFNILRNAKLFSEVPITFHFPLATVWETQIFPILTTLFRSARQKSAPAPLSHLVQPKAGKWEGKHSWSSQSMAQAHQKTDLIIGLLNASPSSTLYHYITNSLGTAFSFTQYITSTFQQKLQGMLKGKTQFKETEQASEAE